jgi:hypothetical protein
MSTICVTPFRTRTGPGHDYRKRVNYTTASEGRLRHRRGGSSSSSSSSSSNSSFHNIHFWACVCVCIRTICVVVAPAPPYYYYYYCYNIMYTQPNNIISHMTRFSCIFFSLVFKSVLAHYYLPHVERTSCCDVRASTTSRYILRGGQFQTRLNAFSYYISIIVNGNKSRLVDIPSLLSVDYYYCWLGLDSRARNNYYHTHLYAITIHTW